MPDPPPFNSSHTYVQKFTHFIVNSHLEGCCVSYHVAVSQSLKLKCSFKVAMRALCKMFIYLDIISVYIDPPPE